jgi:hypothetical protein
MGLLILIFGALLAIAARGRVLLRTEERQAQAGWLAQAGVERAAAALAGDAAYAGEIWEIEADRLMGRDAGRVAIEVARIEGSADLRRVTAIADYPVEESRRARERLEVDVNIEILRNRRDGR